ncbi:MAG TPA: DUF948 domain-containing protein [Syntrophorhabdaceae bacterium]|nr:DUF948 domain-containing protein [Syntrophorhabdaceae bacterium]HPU29044.1 DUF948 domain-containing protein [Syntrophorhabdaceae bacterium]
MNTIFLGIITACFVLLVIALIYFLKAIKESIKNLEDKVISSITDLEKRMDSIESSLNPTFNELPKTLSSFRNFADTLTEITNDVKEFTESMRSLGYNIKNISASIERISSISAKQISGIKAGIEAACNVLYKHYINKWSNKKSI